MDYRQVQRLVNGKCQGLGGRVRLGLSVAIACTIIILTPAKMQGSQLTQWRFDPIETQLELTLDSQVTPRYTIIDNPLRIIVDLPDTEVTVPLTQQSYSGAVRQISVDSSESGQTRLILELSPGVTLAPEPIRMESVSIENGRYKTLIRPVIMTEPSSSVALPPATFNTHSNQPLVKVPPLNPRRSDRAAQADRPTPGASAASLTTQPASVETTPGLVGIRIVDTPKPTPSSPALPPIGSSVIPVMEFGQPFPPFRSGRNVAQRNVQDRSSELLLPSQTVLKLRYPGNSALYLTPGIPLQEVLLIDQAVRDRSGKMLLPVGTPVIGRFELQGQQSRFRVQAIVVGDRTLTITAQSDPLNTLNSNGSTMIEAGQLIEIRP